MDFRRCHVTVCDINGIDHTVEVTASSLYEAVALGLRLVRDSQWAGEIPQNLKDVIVCVAEVRVEHRVSVGKFNEWLGRGGGSPKELAQRKRVRELLDYKEVS